MHYPVPFEAIGVQLILLLDLNTRTSSLVTRVRRFVLCPRVLILASREWATRGDST